MINVVSNLIGAFCMLFSSLYIWSKLYKKSVNFKDYKFYIVSLVSIFIMIFNYFYNFVFIRILFISIVMAIVNKVIFKECLKKVILSTVLSEFILCSADVIFSLIVIYILKIDLSLVSGFYVALFANIFGFVLSIGIINLKFTLRIYDKLINLIDSIKHRKIILFGLLIIISLNILLAFIYFKLNIYCVLFINLSLICIYSYVIVKNLETSNMNNLIKTENQSLIENLSEYENMLDRQRVDNHENKNQLLIIKNMIKKNDKDVIKYIDTIVTDQKEDDELLYTKVKKIPSGGLQGIIYQKMLVMKDKNIKFSIDVSRDVRKIDLDNFNMNDNYKLCKIIGVFLDNAIEESIKLNDRFIMILLYEDDEKLIIEVSNKFEGNIDLENIDNEGFTTKGYGHGYGLSLVKKIVSESEIFENEKQINNNIFKQIIKVKVK